MKKQMWLAFLFFGLINHFVISCKAATSYGSSKTLNEATTAVGYPEEDQDCIAWRFYLTATLYGMARQTTVNDRGKKIKEDPSYYAQNPLPPSSDERDKLVKNILPAKTAKKIVDTIIKKEGGSCSRELLYDTPCILHGQRGTAYGAGLHGNLHGKAKFEYFSSIIGIPIDETHLDQLDQFLRDHISKSPNTKASYYGFYCFQSTCPVKSYEAGNSFGLCILKKYKKYLKKNELFDVDYHNFYENFHSYKEDKESLRLFIQRSNEIAAETKDHTSKTKPEW